ncbi:MoaD family protein [Halovenus sp. WSH3]|uniref:MoaD family protein n=1 Tax=Halovenus carboxidivorans TaxID=2692199 RepID=A0A6B0SZK5_9EURY|nr:ubiquitin-like small modifier protein 1 [Halovenus carboxidivorans]MXR51298.1 MoaD family protein [Halovenus carboxidivorans]
MNVELRFFANFREAVGQKEIGWEVDGDATVGSVLRDVEAEYPEVDIFNEDGEVREFLSIMKNGRDITYMDGPETRLESDDTVSVFPPVAGG